MMHRQRVMPADSTTRVGAMAGATITARHSTTGAEFKQFSDSNGEYLLVSLLVGEYVIMVEAQDEKWPQQLLIHLLDALRER
jgi:hypothetical protein